MEEGGGTLGVGWGWGDDNSVDDIITSQAVLGL